MAVALPLFFWKLGGHDLWGPDEVRYALVAKEMRSTGEYVLPHLNGGVYLEKPPLQFWLAAASARLYEWAHPGSARVYEWAARFPAACAALLAALLTWRVAARRWDEWTGLVAAVVFATNAQVIWFARCGALDMLLTFAVTLAITGGVAAIDGPRRWAVVGTGGAALGVAAGALTKGPIALLIVATVLFGYGWSAGRLRRAVRVVGLAVVGAAVLVAPWWWAAHMKSGGTYGSVSELWRQTADRAVDSYAHHKPFYHYAVGIFGEFLPWSLFLPGALWYAWRGRGTADGAVGRLAWYWFVPPFVSFSAISGKRGQYLLPLFPGLAMLVAAYLRALVVEREVLSRVKQLYVPAMILGGLVGLAGGALAILPALPLSEWEGLAAWRAPVCLVGIFLAVAGPATIWTMASRAPRHLVTTVAGGMVVAFVVAAHFVLPMWDQFKSARRFGETVRAMAPGATPVVLFHNFRPDIAFYCAKPLRVEWPPQRVEQYGDVTEPITAIMREDIYEELRDAVPPSLRVEYAADIGSKRWLILRNTRALSGSPGRKTVLVF